MNTARSTIQFDGLRSTLAFLRHCATREESGGGLGTIPLSFWIAAKYGLLDGSRHSPFAKGSSAQLAFFRDLPGFARPGNEHMCCRALAFGDSHCRLPCLGRVSGSRL